jgi:NAD+ kinase
MFAAIEHHGFEYSVNEDFANIIEAITEIRISSTHRYTHSPRSTHDDVLVTYGGDGTLLDALSLRPTPKTPVVGINCGRLGYLTADDGQGIEELFEAIAERRLRYEERLMLTTEGMPQECFALNEICIHRYGASMISVETLINDNYVATYHGDGLVVATPTGSTAYSLSAGGPIVDPLCRCFVLSPIAPHNLTMRPVVIPDSSTVTLRISSRGGEAQLSADNHTYTLNDGAEVKVRLASKRVILAMPHNNTFYDTLREKMMWGVDRR